MRLLLAEDDAPLSEALRMGLESTGYVVDAVKSGTEASSALKLAVYDALILDLGLPEMDGSLVLKELRSAGNTVPVIIITARDAVADKIAGLDLGANDYLTKPFDFGELEARIRALLRKNVWGNRMEIIHGPIRFVTNTRELYINDERAEFTQREVAVLELLLKRAGKLVGKRLLVEHVSTWEEASSENAIEIVIHRLRRKLEAAQVKIRTVHGFGYLLEEPA
jgi:two-component system OmpR family response regulator